jgi:hypothetical protein
MEKENERGRETETGRERERERVTRNFVCMYLKPYCLFSGTPRTPHMRGFELLGGMVCM